jgi:hypothetical protein
MTGERSMHEFRVNFAECSFSEYASDYENLILDTSHTGSRPSAPSSFARITSNVTAFADSAHPDRVAGERSMHEFRVDFSNALF